MAPAQFCCTQGQRSQHQGHEVVQRTVGEQGCQHLVLPQAGLVSRATPTASSTPRPAGTRSTSPPPRPATRWPRPRGNSTCACSVAHSAAPISIQLPADAAICHKVTRPAGQCKRVAPQREGTPRAQRTQHTVSQWNAAQQSAAQAPLPCVAHSSLPAAAVPTARAARQPAAGSPTQLVNHAGAHHLADGAASTLAPRIQPVAHAHPAHEQSPGSV